MPLTPLPQYPDENTPRDQWTAMATAWCAAITRLTNEFNIALTGETAAALALTLAAITGSGSIGHQGASVAAEACNVQDVLRERESILRYVPKTEWPAIRGGYSSFDCIPALGLATASVTCGSGYYVSGPGIYFPPGNYYFNSAIQLKKRVKLYGDGSGQPSGEQAILRFPADVHGIIVHRYNTFGESVEATPTTGADGSIIEGLTITGVKGTVATHGIWLRARATVSRCQISYFKGNGIAVIAGQGAGGANEGNANGWCVDAVRIIQCGADGIYTKGADANAGRCTGADVASCGGWGVNDQSFLGNAYIACQVAACTAGPYQTTNANARSVFIGCYSESGQPASNIAPPSIVVGGMHGAGHATATPFVGADLLGAQIGPYLRVPTVEIGFGQPAASGDGLKFTDTGGGYIWTLAKTLGRWGFKWANLGAPGFLSFYDRNATVANGYARDLSAANGGIGLEAHYAGSASQMKLRDLGDTAPTSGTYLRGDIRTRLNPSAGGKVGIVCTTGGVAGSTAVFKDYGGIDA